MGKLAENGLILCHLVEQAVLRLRSLSMLNHKNPGCVWKGEVFWLLLGIKNQGKINLITKKSKVRAGSGLTKLFLP